VRVVRGIEPPAVGRARLARSQPQRSLRAVRRSLPASVSLQALSQQLPRRPIDAVKPYSVSKARKSLLAYWLPRPLWKFSPDGLRSTSNVYRARFVAFVTSILLASVS
jgi:hypothetical protein